MSVSYTHLDVYKRQDNLCGHRFDRQYGELPLGYDHKYVYSHFGYNLKATDMQAAIGCAQLDKFPSFVERRRHNFDRLKAAPVSYTHLIFLISRSISSGTPMRSASSRQRPF